MLFAAKTAGQKAVVGLPTSQRAVVGLPIAQAIAQAAYFIFI